MSSVEYHTILKYWLMIFLFRVDEKEVPVNFLKDPLDGRSTLKPTDLLMYEWVGEKHACLDLTGVSPLVGLRTGGFNVEQVTLKAASSNMVKHEKTCSNNKKDFIPFVFDTFGFLAPETIDLL
ncbi:unnamed protein product [Lathyrus sativus]|nr:unnamed protein product [Lathyrus sativus]